MIWAVLAFLTAVLVSAYLGFRYGVHVALAVLIKDPESLALVTQAHKEHQSRCRD